MENTLNQAAGKADTRNTGFIPGILAEGKDYGFINGSRKPILYKAGAEKLLSFLKLNIDSLTCVNNVTDLDRNFLDFTYRCAIRDCRNNITGISEGSSNSLEERFRNTFEIRDVNLLSKSEYREKMKSGDGKWLRKSGRWIWTERNRTGNAIGRKNFIQKTAQRRAFVGAVLMAAGLSDFFSQL